MAIATEKPSFFESLKAGFFGMVRGAVIVGAIGLVAGAGLGALLGGIGIVPGGAAAVATVGAIGFAQMGVSVGGLIGSFTGIAMSREAVAVDAQDVINVANISFAQGVETGRSKSVSKEAFEELAHSAGHFQEKLKAEQQQASFTPHR